MSAALRDGRHAHRCVACGGGATNGRTANRSTCKGDHWCDQRNHSIGDAGDGSPPRRSASALIAAACSDKKDDDAVTGGTDDTTAPEETDAAADTTAPADTASEGATATTAGGEGTGTTGAPETTEPAVEPVYGGTLVVSGEAEVANPWTPAAMQCDSYCQQRARTFFDPLAAFGNGPRGARRARRVDRAERGQHGVDGDAARGHQLPRRHAAQRRRGDPQPPGLRHRPAHLAVRSPTSPRSRTPPTRRRWTSRSRRSTT